jgi:hypothetical protein
MVRSAVRPRRKVFHATMEVTRLEEWFVEAETEEEARILLERGDAHRGRIGESVHFEIGKLSG